MELAAFRRGAGESVMVVVVVEGEDCNENSCERCRGLCHGRASSPSLSCQFGLIRFRGAPVPRREVVIGDVASQQLFVCLDRPASTEDQHGEIPDSEVIEECCFFCPSTIWSGDYCNESKWLITYHLMAIPHHIGPC